MSSEQTAERDAMQLVAEGKDLVLDVRNLRTFFDLDEGVLKAVNGVSYQLERGMTLGIVGESGCGKSVSAQSIMRIVPDPGRVEGSINFYRKGASVPIDLAALPASGEQIRSIRGNDIAMIFQEPMTSFSPLHTIGNQIMETLLLHRTSNTAEAREIAVDMLAKVGIPAPAQRVDEYPHQLSGGMRQRAMIAMALACNPDLLIADEPTTALDVTVQAQVIDLMLSLRQEYGMSMLYITHDLGVIAEVADFVAVMYLGKIVEYATIDDIFYAPMHPYTKALLRSIPKMTQTEERRLAAIQGSVPVPIGRPPECPFHPRCEEREGVVGCTSKDPDLIEVEPGHFVRCFQFG